MNDFAPGQQLCHCTLLMRCGAGAAGEVWLVRDEVDAPAALKIVPNGGRFSEREIAGLRYYRKCDHPNLLRIRHIEITPEYLFYTMDAADDLHHGKGGYLPDTLANRLHQYKRMDGADISAMLDGLLAGLSELHRHHFVHRDIKPDNILWLHGRPVLADAGLIAPSGAGSLAGTPGFLSPRLLSGKKSAEPEDDFYALGKVVYCALTGNPVEEYPSIPRDLTLSGNADWNRLFREICESPVATEKAFREKMQFQTAPAPRHVWRWTGIVLLLLLLLTASAFFLRPRRNTSVPADMEKPVPPRAAAVPEIREDSSAAERQWKNASPVMTALRDAGLYDKEQLAALLDVPWYSRNEFFSRLEKCGQNPRMTGFPRYFTDKKASPLERELMNLCSEYGECRLGDLKSRQFYWYGCHGDRLAVQRKMLAEDPVMQAAALDHLIFETIDRVLAAGRLEAIDKTRLPEWIRLKNALLQ